jgi:hypothetical protein
MFVVLVRLALALSFLGTVIDKSHGASRYVFALLFIGVSVLFIQKIALGTAYPDITAEWTEGNYARGTNIDGLAWQDG